MSREVLSLCSRCLFRMSPEPPKNGLLCSGGELNLRIRRLLSPDKLTYIVSGRSYNPQLSYD